MQSDPLKETNHIFPDPDSPSPFNNEDATKSTDPDSPATLSSADEPIGTLNVLVEANRNLVSTYDVALNQLETDANKSTVMAHKEQYEYALAQLSNLVVSLDGDPEAKGTMGKLFDKALLRFKGLTNQADGEMLDILVENGNDLLDRYQQAMNPPMDEEIRNVIRSQMSTLRINNDKLKALAAAYQD